MAYIAPNTSVILYSNVPLDKDYNHTYWFSSKTFQDAVFLSPAAETGITILRTLNRYSYVRDGVIKVQVRKEELEGCNYMRFVNSMDITSPNEPKVFYAFVDSVRWVNNETTEIEYTIDIIQSYLFDVELLDSYVEREHSNSDIVGEYHIEEDVIPTIDYVYDKEILEVDFTPDKLVWYCNRAQQSTSIGGHVYENQGQALHVFGSSCTDAAITSVLASYDYGNYVDLIYQVPEVLQSSGIGVATPYYETFNSSSPSSIHGLVASNLYPGNGNFGNYTPKNNKMYNFPYTYVLMTNYSGDVTILKPEMFDSFTNPEFVMIGSCCPSPAIMCFPHGYRGYSVKNDIDESVTLSNFPQVPFTGSTFGDFINRNGLAMGISAAMSIASGFALSGISASLGASAATSIGIASRGAVSTANNVANSIGSITSQYLAPNDAKGLVTQANGIRAAHQLYKIGIYLMRITEDNAKIIDDYFTKFGYACKTVKIPNRNVRSRFTYTKTSGCCLRGSAPSNILEAIKRVYDRGITFWQDYAHFCDYSITNAIPAG